MNVADARVPLIANSIAFAEFALHIRRQTTEAG
jgi:hypothetical protein